MRPGNSMGYFSSTAARAGEGLASKTIKMLALGQWTVGLGFAFTHRPGRHAPRSPRAEKYGGGHSVLALEWRSRTGERTAVTSRWQPKRARGALSDGKNIYKTDKTSTQGKLAENTSTLGRPLLLETRMNAFR